MKRFLVSLLIVPHLVSCGQKMGSIPGGQGTLAGYCPVAPFELESSGFKNADALSDFLSQNRVTVVNAVPLNFLIQFAFELKKFPLHLNEQLAKRGRNIRLFFGEGVGQDPAFTNDITHNGRRWNTVPGAGNAVTTWIVPNRLYEGHGSVNLVLHERAHTLDGTFSISSGSEWTDVLASDSELIRFLDRVCGDYCTKDPAEAFAESFAIYHACPESRALLQGARTTIQLLDSL